MEAHADRELLAAWRAGDQEALAVLIARHHAAVLAACRRQAPAGELDDCVQAVFLVLSRRPAAAGRAPVLLAWLLRVARLVCRQANRGRARRWRAEQAAATQPVVASAPHPEALDHLDDCLQRLPAKQRDALCLHFLAGQDPAEVAATLGTSRDQVYLLVHRGLAGLRSLLARRGFAVGSTALTALLSGETAAAGPAPVTLVTSITAATPSPGAVALASGAMSAMTIATLTPFFAAAGLVLTVGMATLALSGEATPAPVPAPTPAPAPAVAAPPPPPPTPAMSVVPLNLLGLKPGQEISLTGQPVVAEATGLLLPLGRQVELRFAGQQQGAETSLLVTSVNADTGHMAPAWAFDDPVIKPDGSVIAVGFDIAMNVPMARQKAMLKASSLAMRARLPGETTVTGGGEQAGPGNRHVVTRTTINQTGEISLQSSEYVFAVCVDPASLPPRPLKPGTSPHPRDPAFGGMGRVACWVRVTANVQATPLTEEEKRRRMAGKSEADRTFKELDAKIDEEKPKPSEPKP